MSAFMKKVRSIRLCRVTHHKTQTIGLWRAKPSGFSADHRTLAWLSDFRVPLHFESPHIVFVSDIFTRKQRLTMNSFSFFWTLNLTIREHESIFSNANEEWALLSKHVDFNSIQKKKPFRLIISDSLMLIQKTNVHVYILAHDLSICVNKDTMKIYLHFLLEKNQLLKFLKIITY